MLALAIALTLAQFGHDPYKPRPVRVGTWDEAAGPVAALLDRAYHVEAFRIGEERLVQLVDKRPKVYIEGDADLFRRKHLGGRDRIMSTAVGIAGFPVIAVDPTPPADLLPRILATLRDAPWIRTSWKNPDGTFTGVGKLCGPLVPVFAYRFQTPDGFVELLMCFRCAQADLFFRGERARLHIDLVNSKLLSLAQESFPFDAFLNQQMHNHEFDETNLARAAEFDWSP